MGKRKNTSKRRPFHPRSPYAIAKLYAYWIIINYREAYGMYACNGILFNHESPRRGETFVTKKITRGLTQIHKGLENFFTWEILMPREIGDMQEIVLICNGECCNKKNPKISS